MTKNNVGVTMSVTRGPETWTYIYIVLGFAIAIEGTIIQMIAPLVYPYSLIVYVALGAFTFWLFIFNGWFQNKLVTMKLSYEKKGR
jgi:hypothetical protein